LHNWIEDLHLRCVSNWEIGMFGSVFFLGNVMGGILLSSFGDTHGRIGLIRLSMGLSLLMYIVITYLTRDILVIYFGLFFIGFLSCWRLSLAYIYGQEIVGS
jgi:MFS family permease